MRDFPQELIDQVIDHVALSDSVKDIGVVCKTWVPRSRFHLFSDVVLFGGNGLRIFLERIQTSSLKILPLIRWLQMDFANEPFEDTDLACLRHCTDLVSLRLVTPLAGEDQGLVAQVYAFLNTHLPYLGLNCHSLSHFHWLSRTDISVRTIIDILSSLPALESFRISGSNHITAETPPSSCSFPAHLHTLDILVDHGVDLFFAWLLSLPVLPRMQSLSFEGMIEDMDGPLMAYLQRTGSGLKSFSLEAWSPLPLITEAFHQRVLGYTSNLSELKLQLQTDAQVLTILAMIQSSSLRKIHIVVDFPWDEDVPPTSPPWSLIDQALADPRFASIQSFSFERDIGPSSDIFSLLAAPEVVTQMPLAHARGILQSFL
ncbi:hypothetical protein DFH09DRAFT_1032311 [Mycena vulgaris]|nr:hypothetical protein DFH09DRAFT_1032311 [Mycena vulgaris]